MTKIQKSERDEAIQSLRETLKPGDTVYTVLRSVSRSGMSRDIDLYKLEPEGPRWLSRIAARACNWTWNNKRECVKVGGCGMDMGFHLVYNLSRTLFDDSHPFTCTGDKCPSNDHSNAYYHERDGECVVCRAKVNGNGRIRKYGTRGYKVCSAKCAIEPWKHSDGGYALNHRWM